MNSTNDDEKVEIIKPNSKKKAHQNFGFRNTYNSNKKFLSPIIMGIAGLILLTNSDSVIMLMCYVIGGLILGYGIYNIIGYYQLKKEMHIEDSSKMTSGIVAITIGIFIILIASLIKTFLNLILGIWLISIGIAKLIKVPSLYNGNRQAANFNLIEALILILMGLYSILVQNIFLALIGVWLIIYAGVDLYKILKK